MTYKEAFPTTLPGPAHVEKPFRIDYSKPLADQIEERHIQRARLLEEAALLLEETGWCRGTREITRGGHAYCAVGALSQAKYGNANTMEYEEADKLFYGDRRDPMLCRDSVHVLNDVEVLCGREMCLLLRKQATRIRKGQTA